MLEKVLIWLLNSREEKKGKEKKIEKEVLIWLLIL